MKAIVPCLWFNNEAEEAANYYCAIFKTAQLGTITRYGNEGKEIHGGKPGNVLTVEFSLDGHKFLALNGGPIISNSTRRSRSKSCARPRTRSTTTGRSCPPAALRRRSSAAGSRTSSASRGRSSRPCCRRCLVTRTAPKADRVMKALLQMKKLDIAALQRAHSRLKRALADVANGNKPRRPS